jgi:L-ornithine Nalpha-acyltransferase
LNSQSQITRRGALKIRMARTSEEIRVAQKLRYLVFHSELGAKLNTQNRLDKIESDAFDDICDHLLVIRETGNNHSELLVHDGSVIGTYRLLKQSVALQNHGFYSQAEFDVMPLLARKPDLKFLELGRSCVLKDERGSAVIEILWRGIWDYVRYNQMDVMIGCASFDGTDIDAHQNSLQFLLDKNSAPEDWHVAAHPLHRINLKTTGGAKQDLKSIISQLPPLIKGYLRLGCFFGDGAVIDEIFNTIDVLVILPISQINPRYFTRFGEPTN